MLLSGRNGVEPETMTETMTEDMSMSMQMSNAKRGPNQRQGRTYENTHSYDLMSPKSGNG